MFAPGVEHPGRSGRHMNSGIATTKLDARVGAQRNVDAMAIPPVAVQIDVRCGLAAGHDPHHPRAPDWCVERGEHRDKRRQTFQDGCRTHVPVDGIVIGRSVRRHDRQRVVAVVPLGMGPPPRWIESVHLGNDLVDIHLDLKSSERLVKSHALRTIAIPFPQNSALREDSAERGETNDVRWKRVFTGRFGPCAGVP